MEPITTLFFTAWAAKSGAAVGWFKWRKRPAIHLRGRAYCEEDGKPLEHGYFIGSILATNHSKAPNSLVKVSCKLIDPDNPSGKTTGALFDCELPIDVPPGRRAAVRFRGKILEPARHRPELEVAFTDRHGKAWTTVLRLPAAVLLR